MSSVSSSESSRGVAFTVAAFICWGLFPLYWKPLHDVPALQILCHRIAWSAVFVAIILTVRNHWGWSPAAVREPRKLAIFGLSSLLLSLNWLIYIWAVNAGHVVEGAWVISSIRCSMCCWAGSFVRASERPAEHRLAAGGGRRGLDHL